MKVSIENLLIDFSTITHIENNEKEIILFVFMGDNIVFKNDFNIMITADLIHDTEESLKIKYKDEIEEFEKHQAQFENLKNKIISIWKQTESCIKDIKKLK